MSRQDKDMYRALQEHLDKMPVGFPATESGIELKILKHLFTEEDAEIALKLNYIPVPLSKIYKKFKKTGVSEKELEQKLDGMYQKGLINHGKRIENGEEVKYYANAPLVIGMFEYQLNNLTKEFVLDIKQYFEEAFFEEYNKPGVPQLRTIPLEHSISQEQGIATYDDLKSLIENSKGPIALAECICRKATDLLEDPCKKTDLRETCFSFGGAADFYIEKGLGREIKKEEALEVLKKVEDAGLVLQPGNSQRPMNICCCCGCCCEVLVNQKRLAEPARLFATNFYAEVNQDDCIGCGTCVERCNMDAIVLDDAIARVLTERCIGCGACVPTCTSEAIRLIRKAEDVIPPLSTRDTYLAIMDKKAELARTAK
jgi:electron transport complex protein RnfB